MKVMPFACLRPAPDKAREVAALPYDVFDREEAAAYVADRPLSFLNIDRPETQFPPSQDMYAPEVYAKAHDLLEAREADGTFVSDGHRCYYLYRLEMDGHSQTGIVACCSIDEYLDGTIKRHENTRPEKERDRISHIIATGAQTGPIFLAYRDEMALDVIVGAASAATPLYDFTDDQGVRNTVWRIARPEAIEAIEATFEHIGCAYIADGHHRAASAVKAGISLRESHPSYTEKAPFNSFLSVLFPASQLEVLSYNRVVSDVCGLGADGLVSAATEQGFDVTQANGPVTPERHGTFGLFVEDTWWHLSVGESLAEVISDASLEDDGPVASLDVSVLQDHLLSPVLGIKDPTTDGRISFVGGIRGTDELERRAGECGAAFTMFATSVDELMSVADAGLLMPPKSTWFEPKLRSGLFIHRI